MSRAEELFSSIVRKSAYALLSTCLLGTVVYAGYQVTAEKKRRFNDKIDPIIRLFDVSDEQLETLMKTFDDEVHRQLKSEIHQEATVKMYRSFIEKLPQGNETGHVLALDLGGTHFRLLSVDFQGSGKMNVVSKRFVIPQSLMTGNGENLFRHLSECLADFLQHEQLLNNGIVYPLGFTFSFPCEQTSLTSARLTSWTKGFTCDGVVGENVIQLLQKSFDEKKINVKCVALINDAVGTLMCSAYKCPTTRIGLILGTGTNVSYIENDIINVEWGAFGENHRIDYLRTKYDDEIDQSSKNQGKQIFEKMISGMYLGELVRLVLVDFYREKFSSIKENQIPLFNRGSFYTKYISMIEIDDENHFEETQRILDELFATKSTDEDCRMVQEVCREISSRAARLVAAALSVLINRMNQPLVTIGVDGALYKNHPRFAEILRQTMKKFVKKNLRFEFISSDECSGLGAAIVAVCVSQ